MKKFITRLVLFCAVAMAVPWPLGYVVDSGLRKSHYFYYAEWNDLFNGKTNSDMLILGTSRTWIAFSPQILDSTLGVNSYNMGIDGTPFDIQYERFKLYLRYNKKKPKYVLQEVGFNVTFAMTNGLPFYQQFIPYYYDTAVWRLMKSAYPDMNVVDRYFPLYKYNNQIPLVKEGIMSFLGKGMPARKYKGYQAQDFAWDSSFNMMIKKNPGGITCPVEPRAVALFREYLELCNANDIKVIIVYVPIYYEMERYVKNWDELPTLLNKLSKEYNVPILDYRYKAIDSNINYFYNSSHLKREGAVLFSKMLAEDLKQYIR